MCVEGTWNISTIDENNPELNYGAFQIPTEDGEQPMVGTNSCGYGVSATTENPDAALAFVNYFVSEGRADTLDQRTQLHSLHNEDCF